MKPQRLSRHDTPAAAGDAAVVAAVAAAVGEDTERQVPQQGYTSQTQIIIRKSPRRGIMPH